MRLWKGGGGGRIFGNPEMVEGNASSTPIVFKLCRRRCFSAFGINAMTVSVTNFGVVFALFQEKEIGGS